MEGLGPSQLVGRQVLGSPCLGEIQLGIADRKGHLEVEVIRARGLMAKPGAKILPGGWCVVIGLIWQNDKNRSVKCLRMSGVNSVVSWENCHQVEIINLVSDRKSVECTSADGNYSCQQKNAWFKVLCVICN